MARVEIIGVRQSSLVRTVRIVAEEKRIDYALVEAPPHSPFVTAIHPLGKIPVLRHGDFTLFESRAIACYLDKAFPGGPLTPPELSSQVEQWVSMFLTAFDQILIRDYLLGHIFPGTADGKPDPARIEAAWKKARPLLDVVETALGDEPFLVGGAFTLAEAYIAPMLHYLKDTPEAGEHIARSQALRDYLALLLDRPSVKAAVA